MKYLFTALTAVLLTISILLPHTLLAEGDTTLSIKVQGRCSMCKDRIEAAAKGRGVLAADWNETSRLLRLTINPLQTSVAKIEARIAAAGHDTENRKAPDEVYQSLPECCLYRDAGPETMHPADGAASVQGIVLQEDAKGRFSPLEGASVVWMNSKKGSATNAKGVFTLPGAPGEKYLLISFVGFAPDTVEVMPKEPVMVVLARLGTLQEVKVSARQRSLFISTTNAFRTQVITEKELYKAACCNLSESFETNPSVDVSFTDAVSGSRQIQLLGLSGNYTQLTLENLPGPRGLAMPMGLQYVPGTWVQSIQLTKGAGSVVNGFESIAGQINVEMKKPENAERMYANVYVNNMGKTDLNLNLSQKVGNKWSTALLLHHARLMNHMDFNNDGYRDLPTGNLYTVMNRWKYEGTNGWMMQLGVKYLGDHKTGGDITYKPEGHQGSTHMYGLGWTTGRYEGFAKIGYVFPGKKYQSFGLQLSAFNHSQDAYYGITTYDASQQNAYANLIYQSIIGNTNHKFRTGLSLLSDNYHEKLAGKHYNRRESVPGAFFEYSYDGSKKWGLVAGLRADNNNLFGWFATPRLHLRYQPFTNTTIRLSAGRGQRTANIFAENTAILVSSRQLEIVGAAPGLAYGLQPEVAWNKGLSIDQKFRAFGREAVLSADFFRNDFTKQVVLDIEDPRKALFYNLQGVSYSNSFQTELQVTPAGRFDVRLAYRLFDVKTTYGGKLLQKPLLSKHRAFINLAYEIKGWKMDYTAHYNSARRIPSTQANPAALVQPLQSPGYVLMNAQVSKLVGKKSPVEIYLGGENLGNFLQMNAIVDPKNPFGPFFDASLIWGPVTGRMIYGGLRWKLGSVK